MCACVCVCVRVCACVCVCVCVCMRVCVFPAAMETIWDSKSLSEESGLHECKSILSTPAHHSLLSHGGWYSRLQAGCQAEAALEAGSRQSATRLCLSGWPREVLLTSTTWPLTPHGPWHQRALMSCLHLQTASGNWAFTDFRFLCSWLEQGF